MASQPAFGCTVAGSVEYCRRILGPAYGKNHAPRPVTPARRRVSGVAGNRLGPALLLELAGVPGLGWLGGGRLCFGRAGSERRCLGQASGRPGDQRPGWLQRGEPAFARSGRRPHLRESLGTPVLGRRAGGPRGIRQGFFEQFLDSASGWKNCPGIRRRPSAVTPFCSPVSSAPRLGVFPGAGWPDGIHGNPLRLGEPLAHHHAPFGHQLVDPAILRHGGGS